MEKEIILIRGGGDIATGIIQKFFRAGFPVLVLETDKPLAIRRSVSLCDAVYKGFSQVEDLDCQLIKSPSEAEACWRKGKIPLLVDPECRCVSSIKAAAIIDAIIAKKNLGTKMEMAPISIAVGPGFCAGKDVDVVIESMRGHDLGRLIFEGCALPNTSSPGEIGGKSQERVIHSPAAGIILHDKEIGEIVLEGEALCHINETAAPAPFTGLLRGLIQENIYVKKDLKIADIDPRTNVDWRSISDKARCIGGSALEAYLYLKNKRNEL